jgi:hypothetical protein
VLYLLTLATVKASIVLLLRRIFLRAETILRAPVLCNVLLGAVVVWAIGSVVAITAECDVAQDPSQSPTARCPGLVRFAFPKQAVYADLLTVGYPMACSNASGLRHGTRDHHTCDCACLTVANASAREDDGFRGVQLAIRVR